MWALEQTTVGGKATPVSIKVNIKTKEATVCSQRKEATDLHDCIKEASVSEICQTLQKTHMLSCNENMKLYTDTKVRD